MSGDRELGRSGFLEMLIPPFVFAVVSMLLILYFREQLVIGTEWLPQIFGMIVIFGFFTGLLLKVHFEYADNALVFLLLMLFYSIPVVAWMTSDRWVGLAETESTFRFIGIVGSGLFVYLSVYSILFLGIEALFNQLNVDINKSPLRWLLPGFGIDIDDKAKHKSFLIWPAAASLVFSITICYYLIDLEYPYSLFAYSLRDSNTLADIMSFTIDETLRSWPIGDIWEIWGLSGSTVDVEPQNQLFQLVRTIINIALSLAFALGIIFLSQSSDRETR